MKVERINSGYYKVEGAKHIRIETGYITDTKRCYELNIRSIDSTWKVDRIFYTTKLETLKNFLNFSILSIDNYSDIVYYIIKIRDKEIQKWQKSRKEKLKIC